MASMELIESRVLRALSHWEGTESREIYGGVCYHLNGEMLCGVWEDYLILRLGPARATEALQTRHVKDFMVKGEPLKGWVMVEVQSISDDEELSSWLVRAREFVVTLPAREAS